MNLGTILFLIGLLVLVIGLLIGIFVENWSIFYLGIIVLCLGIIIWIFSLAEAAIFGRRRINKQIKQGLEELEEKQTQQEITKLQSAKTGEPIKLTGYGVIDPSGEDTGKRFIRKEDAENYVSKMSNNKKLNNS
ncbi:hypothetical protein D4R51_00740 [bacterium]|nr:MAG: hypothetical protein D4R51_00740 [bacterium]